MASDVEICNTAMSYIRAGSINGLAETSLQAQQCSLHFAQLRDELLREYDWGFAHKIVALAPLATSLFNWVYSYQYPSDCLYINKLLLNFEQVGTPADGAAIRARTLEEIYALDLDAQVKYEIYNDAGKKIIASNEANLRIDYRARITDTTLFDSIFVDAMAWGLAARTAIAIVGVDQGRQLRSDALQMYNSILAKAAAANRNESYREPLDSDFVNIRR